MKTVFVAHGAPTLALDHDKGRDLSRWAATWTRPKAILAFSAHWQTPNPTLGAVTTLPLVYDFHGFPSALYRLRYPAPAAPELAGRVRELLSPSFTVDFHPERGLDHGVWVPLLHLSPQANIPVLQVGLPLAQGPARLIELGKALAPLRSEGVLILCSGNLTHNLRRLDFGYAGNEATTTWAREFDTWVANALNAADIEALCNVPAAPNVGLAHPTLEHYLPLLVSAGAAHGEPLRFPLIGFEYGTLSRRCVEFGA
jgi:4,5-DOPA dioxygenase extradiol